MPLCPHYSSIVFDNQRNRNKERRLMENLKLELIKIWCRIKCASLSISSPVSVVTLLLKFTSVVWMDSEASHSCPFLSISCMIRSVIHSAALCHHLQTKKSFQALPPHPTPGEGKRDSHALVSDNASFFHYLVERNSKPSENPYSQPPIS
jgi:hypothetical protein